jgi:hypothetical protein
VNRSKTVRVVMFAAVTAWFDALKIVVMLEALRCQPWLMLYPPYNETPGASASGPPYVPAET